jgi:hypothetical protein
LLAENRELQAERQLLVKQLVEKQLLQEEQLSELNTPYEHFAGANLWPQQDAWWPCMPTGTWPETENWMQCWPEGWRETLWQEYSMLSSWQDSVPPMEAPFLEVSAAKPASIACDLDAVDTSIEEFSAESTEEGYTVSGSTSEDDCSSPEPTKERGDVGSLPKDGVQSGQALLALLEVPELEDAEFNEDSLSTDDLLLIRMEERESKESGADEKNDETFGPDATEGWSVAEMFAVSGKVGEPSVKIDSPKRLLPPAPKELPPTPPMPELSEESSLVFPPGLPIPIGVDTCDEVSTASPSSPLSIEPPPGLSLSSRQESNSGSDADESDMEMVRAFSTDNNQLCWSSWLVKASDEKPKPACNARVKASDEKPKPACNVRVKASDEKPKPACNVDDSVFPKFLSEDTQKSSDEELPVMQTGVVSPPTLPQLVVADSNVPKARNLNGSAEASSTAARKKPSKPRTKTKVEPRRPRKNQAIASEELEVDPPSTSVGTSVDDVDDVVAISNGRSWVWLLVLGLIILTIGVMATFNEQLLFSKGRGMAAPIMRGESHAWGAQLPQEAPMHSRSQQISSMVTNMDIEIARAKAVGADIKSKLNNKRDMRKAKKQQEQMMMRQRDGGAPVQHMWRVVVDPHAQPPFLVQDEIF